MFALMLDLMSVIIISVALFFSVRLFSAIINDIKPSIWDLFLFIGPWTHIIFESIQ